MGDGVKELVLLVLVALGLVASMLGYIEFHRGGGICDISSWISCSSVYYIPEARLLGLHFSEIAPIYFMAVAGLASLYGFKGSRVALRGILLLAVAGALVVPYLVYLEVARARAICIFCTMMHVSILGSLVASYLLLRELEG